MLINDKVDAVYIPDSPSRIKATDYNQIKNEIQECITEAGLTPTKDVIQLPQALRIMTAQSGAEEVAKIEAAGQEQVQAVNTAGSTQINAVNEAGSTQTEAVNTAGQTQLNAINTAGAQAVQNAQEAAATATSKAAEAADSATEAAGSASTATTQATNASASAELAQKWATQTTAEVVIGQGYGAKYYADQAADSAASIVQDAEAAAASATAAAGSASAAAQSAQEAADNAASVDPDNLAKVDLSNVSQLPQSRINAIMPDAMDYVVDSYSDENGNWYRVYKSKRIEQGGQLTGQGVGWHTVTFLKPFSFVYNLINSLVDAPVVQPTADTLGPRKITNTNFMLYQTYPGSNSWVAIGKGAE